MAFLGPKTVYTVYTCFADLVDSFARRQQNLPPVDDSHTPRQKALCKTTCREQVFFLDAPALFQGPLTRPVEGLCKMWPL